MKILKIYCLRNSQEATFVEKLKKMRIKNHNSVRETYQTVNSITDKN
jgi:predicted ferric reductase